MELIATCAFGLEKVVYKELKQLGCWVIKTENGKVTFKGSEELIAKTNLWLRSADRVLLKMGEFETNTFDELFDQVKALNWSDYISAEDAFPVKADANQSILHSEPAIQSIVKKAIVENLKSKYNLETFPETKAEFPIWIKVNKNQCTVSIDTSGEALHKRGYRTEALMAPIKETLAASLILLSDWQNEQPLVDPFCGSGTIPIEAAMIAENRAPGLMREFNSMHWPWIDKDIWAQAFQEAQEKFNPLQKIKIRGYDIDSEAIKVAQKNAKRAGIKNLYFEQSDFRDLDLTKQNNGTIITNPPYGERLESNENLHELYRNLGQQFDTVPDWSLYLLTAYPHFEKAFGHQADKNRKLYNGKIQCYFYQYSPKVQRDSLTLNRISKS